MIMKKPLFLALIISFFFFFIISNVDSQSPASDSCSSDPLTLQTPLPFNTSALHCVSVWAPQGFILRYAQAESNLWNFVLSAPNTNAYIAIGFSPDGNMVGSRAVVGWVAGDGIPNIKKYHLGGQSPNQVIIEPSEKVELRLGNLSSVVTQSNRIYMAFQVISDTTPTPRLLYAVGPAGRLPSGTNLQLSEHDNRISTTINYATGVFENNKHKPVTSLRKAHGILNMFGWAILLSIGAMVARYMRKWDPLWFYCHASIQTLGFLLGLIGIICGLVLEKRLTGASVGKHKGLGITVLVLGCLQVMAVLARPDKEAKLRKYWNWYHFGVGRLLIFLAAINVFYGIHLGKAGSGWNAGFAAFLIIVFILTVIFELKICFKK
ncbi:hypothetical protein ABFS83_14G060600 [Erythranthe nasuta]